MKISLRDTMIYWLGRMGARSAAIFLLPLYTSFIAPPEWGRFNLLLITGDLLALAVCLSLPTALYRFWAAHPDEMERRRLSGAVFAAPLVASTVLFLPAYIWADAAAGLLGLPGWGAELRMLLVSQQLSVAMLSVQAEMRLRDESKLYAALEIGQNVGQAGLAALLVGVYGMGIWGILVAQLATWLLVTVLLVPRFLRRTHLNLQPRRVRALLVFALPLVPSALAMAAVHNVDRFFIEAFAGSAEVGVYSLGYKLGIVVNLLLLGPFLLIWEPKSFEVARSPDAPREFGAIFSLFLAAALFLMTGLVGASREIVTVMAAPEYAEAFRVVPLVGFAYVLFGMDAIVRVGLLANRRTKTILGLVLAACTINIVGNIVLVPTWGMVGAGWSRLVAFSALFVLDLWFAQRLLPIAWEWKRLSILGFATAVTLAGMYAVQGLTLWPTIVVKLLVMTLYPLLLLVLGFFSLRQLKGLIARARTS